MLSLFTCCIAITVVALVAIVHGLQIPVLYESNHMLIIDKPYGIAHHNDSRDQSPGILQLIRQQRHALENRERLWGVHRLDKVTSGILVLAKDQTTATTLSKFFAQGKIKKLYIGMSSKKPKKKKQGWVSGDMVRSRRETWMLTKKQATDSTNFAKTRFFTAGMNARMSSPATISSVPRTVVMFVPHTGKTHQLRVAAKSMGIALLGDPLYSDGSVGVNDGTESFPVPRTMLHASGISIPSIRDDSDNGSVNIWCEPPFFEEWYSTSNGNDDANLSEEAATFHNTVERLMTKHCEEAGILDAYKRR
jgi:pseudouridine synthase Rlu family protein